MSYHHFTICERGRIEGLHQAGYSARKIGVVMGRHHSSISRELKRDNASTYIAESSQQGYETRRTRSKPVGKFTDSLAATIEEKLSETWSPEQIANTLLAGKLSFKTIYTWLYRGWLTHSNLEQLRQKGKRRKPIETRGRLAIGRTIADRPAEVKSREKFGHWELDTVVSSRGKSKGCLATFVERKSRLYTAIKIPDRSAASMESAIIQVYSALPSAAFKTATSDRGKEFACHEALHEKLGLPLYFADPYCSWQRGSNENANGLLREFYPKKTDLALIDQDDLIKNLFLLNSRPRKCLGWKSPIQVFLHEVSHLA